MYAALVVDGHLQRVAYPLVDLDGMRRLVTADEKRMASIDARLVQEKRDLALYERHADLPSMKDVWLVEGVEFEIIGEDAEEAAG